MGEWPAAVSSMDIRGFVGYIGGGTEVVMWVWGSMVAAETIGGWLTATGGGGGGGA